MSLTNSLKLLIFLCFQQRLSTEKIQIQKSKTERQADRRTGREKEPCSKKNLLSATWSVLKSYTEVTLYEQNRLYLRMYMYVQICMG